MVAPTTAAAVAKLGAASPDPQPVPPMRRSSGRRKNEPQLRAAAALGLAQMKDPRVLPTLQQFALQPPGSKDADDYGITPSRELGIRCLTLIDTRRPTCHSPSSRATRSVVRSLSQQLRDLRSPKAAPDRVDALPRSRRIAAIHHSLHASGDPAASRGGDRSPSQHTSIVIQQSDLKLRDEIAAAILFATNAASQPPPPAPPDRRTPREPTTRASTRPAG